MKRILVSIFSIMILLGFITNANVSAENDSSIVKVSIDGKTMELDKINVNIDGEKVESDVPAFAYKENTLAPVRFIAEGLGAEVGWSNKERAAVIETSNKKIVLPIDSNKAIIDGKEKTIPNEAMVKLVSMPSAKYARTMVPFRFIAEELGASVEWDKDTFTAFIKSNDQDLDTPEEPQEKPEVKPEPIEPEIKPEPEINLNKILSITAKPKSGSKIPEIHIEAEKDISYKDVLSADKNTIIIDIKDAGLENEINVNSNNDSIKSIKANKLEDKKVVRITIDLKKGTTYKINKQSKSLVVSFVNDLQGIEKQTIDGKEAIVIKNAIASKINSFKLSNPSRVVVDLRNTNLNNVGSSISTDIIKELRLGQYTGNEYDPSEQVARVVLDISDNYENPKFVTQERGDDLIIFVEGNKKAPVAPPAKPVTPPINNGNGNGKTVVIDAGHGGNDPGAVANGLREKDLALDVSLKTRDKLQALGYKVLMSRTSDIYPSLSDRYNLANNNNADAFVSVHFNSASAPTATGIETLYSTKNSANKGFAQSIQGQLINQTGERDRGLKLRNNLAVLNGTRGPSSLVELGFINNPNDAKKINTQSYLERCATAIANGIHNFLSR